MKPVLCALDFSESSLHVLKVAFELAARFETNVTILYTYRLVKPPGREIAEYRKSMEIKAREDFDELLRKLSDYEAVKYEFRPEIGFLSDRLEVYGEQNKIGVIVICQEMAATINEHKGQSLQDFVKAMKTPLLIVPNIAS
jgi:hypothetical protein